MSYGPGEANAFLRPYSTPNAENVETLPDEITGDFSPLVTHPPDESRCRSSEPTSNEVASNESVRAS